jgi:hypothetical protein
MPHSWKLATRKWATAIACGALVAVGLPAAPPSGADESASTAVLLRQWFSALEARRAAEPDFDAFLREAPLVLSRTDTRHPGPGGITDWLSELRSSLPEVAYGIDEIRVDPAGENLVRAKLTLDRRGVDAAGQQHVARLRQTWLILEHPGSAPVVVRIDEERLLAFPGTGPQIVCY